MRPHTHRYARPRWLEDCILCGLLGSSTVSWYVYTCISSRLFHDLSVTEVAVLWTVQRQRLTSRPRCIFAYGRCSASVLLLLPNTRLPYQRCKGENKYKHPARQHTRSDERRIVAGWCHQVTKSWAYRNEYLLYVLDIRCLLNTRGLLIRGAALDAENTEHTAKTQRRRTVALAWRLRIALDRRGRTWPSHWLAAAVWV